MGSSPDQPHPRGLMADHDRLMRERNAPRPALSAPAPAVAVVQTHSFDPSYASSARVPNIPIRSDVGSKRKPRKALNTLKKGRAS